MNENGHDPSRRMLLRQSLALAGAAALGGASACATTAAPGAESGMLSSDPHPALGRTLTRIGFGSCANEGKSQPIWDAILARHSDLFIFLGDNIYGDTRDMAVLSAKYAQFAAQPGFAKLRATTPVVAIWDDHDFGENDAGGDYPMKEDTRRMFLDFWDEPAGSPRRDRDGVYASYVFGPPGKRVQVILPDLRYNRTPLLKLDLAGADYETWARARLASSISQDIRDLPAASTMPSVRRVDGPRQSMSMNPKLASGSTSLARFALGVGIGHSSVRPLEVRSHSVYGTLTSSFDSSA